jgi:flagellar M-ring protein FliF
MDFLNKAFAQLADLFRSMTPGARITSALLLAVVVISLGYLFTQHSYGPSVYLMNGESFPPSLIHDMEAAFALAGLAPAEIEGTRIRVPRGQQTAYMAALADASALPRDFGDMMEKALDSGSMWMSREERRERLKIAKQQELSAIISSMKDIDTAMIFWDTDEKPGLSRERVTTASVNVRPKGLHELDDAKVATIRNTVAYAVAGLKPEDVVVTDLNSGRSFRGDSSGLGNATDDPYAARKRMYEENWKSEILTALSRVPGVTVAVNVELDPKRLHRQRKIENDPKTVPVQTIDKSRSTVREGEDPAGRPGYQANQPMALASTTSKASRQEEEESEQTTVNAVSGSTVEIENQGLIPQLVAVSVGVPTSYFEKVWHKLNPTDPNAQPQAAPKTPTQAELDQIRQQEIANIQKAVAALLPPAEGVPDPAQLVIVTAFQDIAPPEMPQPAMSEKAMTWLGQSWSTLGMILLVLVSLVTLRSMIRSAGVAGQSSPASAVPAAEEKEEDEQANAAQRRLQRFQSGLSLKDELSTLVDEDPDAAANILRTWIGHPG